MSTTTIENMSPDFGGEILARHWWVYLLRGLAGVLFGLLAFILPSITLLSLIILFAAYSLVNGIFSFVLAARAPRGSRVGGLVLTGVLGLLAGLIAFLLPAATAFAFVMLIGAWAIVTGVMEVAAAIKLRKIIHDEWLLALAGVATIGFGVLVLFMPSAGALALVWWIGAYGFAFGILLIVLAFKLRGRQHGGHIQHAGA